MKFKKVNLRKLTKKISLNRDTPKTLSCAMTKLIKQMSDGDLLRLSPEPLPCSRHANCFLNVKQVTELNGGKPIYGFLVYNFGKVGLEFVPHAIWQTADGRKIDITPEQEGLPKVLFLEDASWYWETGLRLNTIDLCFPGRLSKNEMTAWQNVTSATIGQVACSKSEWLSGLNDTKRVRREILTSNGGMEPSSFATNPQEDGVVIDPFQATQFFSWDETARSEFLGAVIHHKKFARREPRESPW